MQTTLSLRTCARSIARPPSMWLEIAAFSLVLLLFNTALLTGTWSESFAFLPAAVAHGEWWRIITHPFVHVSWYHLLLDGSAFLLLYTELRQWSVAGRLGVVAASAAGGLLAATTSPLFSTHGLCGLSGIAHGLMAVSAIEMIRRDEIWERRFGWLAFGSVMAKVLVEAVTGNVVLWFLHGGAVGVPIAACHAGGAIGGLAFTLLTFRLRRRDAQPADAAPPAGNATPQYRDVL